MHVVVATDGSRESLVAARYLTSFADPEKITGITVVAVVRPLASVAFANDLSPGEKKAAGTETGSFREAANAAVGIVADDAARLGTEGEDQGAQRLPGERDPQGGRARPAGLVVVSAGGRGPDRHGPGRQHGPACAALRAVPGARRPRPGRKR